MGCAVSSSLELHPRLARRTVEAALGPGGVCASVCLVSLGPCRAGVRAGLTGQTSQAAKPPDKLVIDADQLIYDKDKNTVTAVGSVQLFYQGRILQADRVVYNRATKRVYAEGHAKMTDEHGDIVYGSRFELSDNFRDGFIDSVQVLTSDKTRFTSPRIERSQRRCDRPAKGRIHCLRALQGSPRVAAILAGPRRAHHREPGDAHGLLRGRPDARLGRPGLLHALFLVARLDGQQTDRGSGAAVHLRLEPGLWHQYPLLYQPCAQLRSDPYPFLPLEAGIPGRGRLAAAPVEWRLQRQGDRD